MSNDYNEICLKTIKSLRHCSFFIPAYQRGYRWTKEQVVNMLNDINEFTPKQNQETEETTWYCLQPIVIKEKSENTFEVIDGQQRLTTIYLILHFLNQCMSEKAREKLFSLSYETRVDSEKFLDNIHLESNTQVEIVDFYHMKEAYKNIEEWFAEKNTSDDFDMGSFGTKFKINTKVIWYQCNEENPISVFTRLNMGKIPLTDAELIKALFLNKSDNYYKKYNDETIRLRQLEIANEWDHIEHSLQNDEFWLFLSKDTEKESNRINFIFDLLYSISDAEMNDEENVYSSHAVFNFYYRKFKKQNAKEIWDEVQTCYQKLYDWYIDNSIYHYLGFIIASDINTLIKVYPIMKDMPKDKLKNYLQNLIIEKYSSCELTELDFDRNKPLIRNILLLYNILLLRNNDNEFENDRFHFGKYKSTIWNLEHIASQVEADVRKSDSREDKIQWLKDSVPYLEDSKNEDLPREEIEEKLNKTNLNDDEINHLLTKVNEYFHGKDTENPNSIFNLCLLDEKTNKGYGNAIFPVKREKIIEKDKSGRFIPLGTKHIFFKYFIYENGQRPKISFWKEEDRKAYERSLYEVLSGYIKPAYKNPMDSNEDLEEGNDYE